MERKTYLSIVFATLTLAGCSHTVKPTCNVPDGDYYVGRSCVQHVQADLTEGAHLAAVTTEPGLIIQPFQFTGRTWFDTDKAILRPQGKQELDRLSVQLTDAQSRGLITDKNKVVIIGHTDSRASRGYNQRLSERRAKAVASYLKEKGIPTTSMLALGKGELQPVASNSTPAGMQRNRRVEIHIEGNAIRVVSY